MSWAGRILRWLGWHFFRGSLSIRNGTVPPQVTLPVAHHIQQQHSRPQTTDRKTRTQQQYCSELVQVIRLYITHQIPPLSFLPIMLLLDYQNVLIQSILTERFAANAPAQSIDQVVSDFDGVTFHISTPTSKSQILISTSIKCYRELVSYGAEAVLHCEYGDYITSPEPGYDFSILIDLDSLPSDPETRDELIRRISLLKRNIMAAPFERAFDDFARLAEEASKYTSESAPQGVKEGSEVMAVHYRDEEAIYIKASHDRVTVIFSTVFRDETDRIFGKVFLQEFVDARRRAIQNAPQVLFRSDPPLELQGLKGVGKTGEKGEIGYITFGESSSSLVRPPANKLITTLLLSRVTSSTAKQEQKQQHNDPSFSFRPSSSLLFTPTPPLHALQTKKTNSLTLFSPVSPLSPPSHTRQPRLLHLPHPDLPRLLPLPHQGVKSVYPLAHAETHRRFLAGPEPG